MIEDKLVVVLPEGLPVGLAMNAVALLGISLGKLVEDLVGPDVVDASGTTHPGLVTVPVPVLRASRRQLGELAAKAQATPRLTVVDVPEVAQRSRTYPEYVARTGDTSTGDLALNGIALHGPRAAVTSLTGDLPLYR